MVRHAYTTNCTEIWIADNVSKNLQEMASLSGSCSFKNVEKPTSVFTDIFGLIYQISQVKVSWIDASPKSLWYVCELAEDTLIFISFLFFHFHADLPWFFFYTAQCFVILYYPLFSNLRMFSQMRVIGLLPLIWTVLFVLTSAALLFRFYTCLCHQVYDDILRCNP